MAFQGDSIYWVEVEKVVPNPFQPRVEFHEGKLQELADSIRMYGVLQPLTVTRSEVQRDDGTFYTKYELIAGERRLRASKLANIAQVPVIIREGEENEQEKLELAIIENLQREDLNAVDRALAFRQLADTFGLSHVQVAKKMGRSREYVSNSIRLLGLPDTMLNSLKHGEMMEGHARTLLMLTDRPEEQEVVYKEILLKKLSVREVERIVRKIATDKVRKKNSGEFDANLISLEKRFTDTLGTRVQIQKTDFGGKLTIDYFSEEDLEAILKRMREEAGNASTDATQRISADTGLNVQAAKPTDAPFTRQAPAVIAHREEQKRQAEDAARPEESLNQYISPAAVPTANHQQPVQQPESVLETIHQPPAHQESEVAQLSEIPVYTPPAPQEEMTVEPVKKSAFHHAVTDLFGRSREAQVYESTHDQEVSVDQEVAQEQPATSTPQPVHEEEDEVDLYSMRNFSV